MTYRIYAVRPALRGGYHLIRVLALGAMLGCLAHSNTASGKMQYYSIPEGKAQKTLKMVAVQGGVDLVAMRRLTQGVETPPIEGDFKVMGAFSRLLDGAPIEVIYRPDIDAYTVVKRSIQPSVSELANEPTNTETQEAMNKIRKLMKQLSQSAAAAGIAIGSQYAPAQENENEIYELSPFTVLGDTDEGYGATETLAGTRLRTDVRDLGASITLITEEMMNDIAANNLEELLPYIANTEVGGGMFGTFTSERSVNMFGQGTPTTLARQRPQGATRIRGLATADLTRNYNLTDLPVDSYIIDRMAVQRGANAMLFGLGSPAGLINSQLIQARFADTNKIEFRTDDYGTIRAVFDVNRVLAEDKLAVRIATLYEDQEFAQEPTFEEDRRIFATLTYKPFAGTTVKANIEAGQITANRPDYISPLNGISEQWFNAGMPLATIDQYATGGNPVFPFGTGNHMGNASRAVMNIWAGTDVSEPNTQFNGVGAQRRQPTSSFESPDLGTPGLHQYRFFTSGTYRGQNLGSGTSSNDPADLANHARSEEQGFLDFTNFNYEKIKLKAAELVNEDFSAYDFTIEQLFLQDAANQNAGIELTYHKENYDDQMFDGQWDGIAAFLYVDANPYLADGRPNHNVGRPFTFNVNPQEQLDIFRRESTRAVAFYEFDLSDSSDRNWLGKHVITATVSDQDSYSYHHEAPFNLTPATRNSDEAGAFVRHVNHIGSFTSHPADLSYVGSSVLGASSYSDIKITGHANTTIPQEGQTFTYNVWNRDTQEWQELSGNVIGPGRPRKANVSFNEVQSQAAILHSNWLGDDLGRLVTTIGWREDEVDLNAYITERDEFNLVKVNSWKNLTPVGSQKEDTVSYGAVYHLPKAWAPLSVHYSESENFAPEAGRTDAAGLPHASPGGETKEYGISYTSPEGRWRLRLNKFETNLTNSSVSTPIGNNEAIGEGMIFNIASGYLGEAEAQNELGNTALAAEMVTVADQIIAVAPESLSSVYGFSRAGTYSINFSDPANSEQVANVSAEGYELELTAQPRDGWNIGFNLAKQEVVQTNIARNFIALFDELTPKWQPLFELPTGGGAYADWKLDGVTDFSTFKDRFDQNAGRIEQVKRSEGLSNPEIREWRWNAFTNYRFPDESIFKGWAVGGAIRWQDEVTIGYHSDTFTNALGEVAYTANLNDPISGPSLTQGDIWFSYRPRVFDKIDWTLRLNVRNAMRDKKVIPVKAQPDSPYTEYAQMRVTQPTTFILTSTFEF